MPIIAINKKARFEYHVLETFQAGLSLSGAMVKLIRARKVQATGLYVVWQNDQLEIINMGNESLRANVPLLLKRRQLDTIRERIKTKGVTCVVLNLKTVGRWLKAEIGLVQGKNKADKRKTLKQRAVSRDLAREGLK